MNYINGEIKQNLATTNLYFNRDKSNILRKLLHEYLGDEFQTERTIHIKTTREEKPWE